MSIGVIQYIATLMGPWRGEFSVAGLWIRRTSRDKKTVVRDTMEKWKRRLSECGY